MREVGIAERRLVESWADRALRVRLAEFVDLSARLSFGDHGPSAVLRSVDAVVQLLDDPLAERYEDRPDEREATAAEIARVLDAFRARAPWPIPE